MATKITGAHILAPAMAAKALTVDQFFDLVKMRQRAALSRPDAYAKLAWTFQAVNLRADVLAGIEYEVQDSSGDPFPWPFDLSELFWLCEAANVTCGRWYLEPIIEGVALVDLKWINPLTIEVVEDEVEGITGFIQNRGQPNEKSWGPEDLIWYHRWGLGSDTQAGPCELDVALEATALGVNANAWAAAFFANSAIPAVVLYSEDEIEDEELSYLKRAWKRLTQGVKKAWGTIILRKGVKAEVIGQPPKDLAMASLYKEARSQIAVAFRIPQTLFTDAANYATAREHRLGLYQDTVFPSAKKMAARLNAQLFSKYELELVWQFSTVEVVAQNEAEKASSSSQMITTLLAVEQAGIIEKSSLVEVLNHLLIAMDLPQVVEAEDEPEPEPQGPLTLFSEDELSTEPVGLSDEAWADLRRWRDKAQRLGPDALFTSTHIPQHIKSLVRLGLKDVGLEAFSFLKAISMDEHSQIVQDTIARILAKYEASVADAIVAGDSIDLLTFEADLRAALEPKLIEAATDAGLRAASGVGVEYDTAAVNTEALEWARAYTYDLVRGIRDTTQTVIRGALEAYIADPGMTKGQLKERLNPAFGAHRAELIAVTEVTRAYSAANVIYQAMLEKEAGIKMARVWGYTWSGIDTSGECPICRPLHGIVEDERGIFVHPETGQEYDGPPAHVKCNCSTSLRYQRKAIALGLYSPASRAQALAAYRTFDYTHICDTCGIPEGDHEPARVPMPA